MREDAFTVNGEQLVSMLNSTRAALEPLSQQQRYTGSGS